MHTRIVLALAALAAGAAAAQDSRRPDPTAPQAKVPPLEYRSAFDGYRPFAEEKVAPWRESNDAVKGNGQSGHSAKPPAPGKPDGEKPAAKPTQHGGHR